MSQLRPFRQYDEHDVINLFTVEGTADATTGIVLHDGALVKIHTGWKADNDPVDLAGAIGSVPNNVLSESWSLTAKVEESGAGDTPLGMALVGMRTKDENGELLVYNPRKAAEMGVVVPGQSVPILTRGLVIYKGASSDWTNATTSTLAAGITAYAGADGEVNVTAGSNVPVGVFLGNKDANGFALIKLEL
jgi:hypothetical protein